MEKLTQLENDLRAEYVENNYHTEAVIIAALQAERFDHVKTLSEIAQRHAEAGYITKEDQELRDSIEAGL